MAALARPRRRIMPLPAEPYGSERDSPPPVAVCGVRRFGYPRQRVPSGGCDPSPNVPAQGSAGLHILKAGPVDLQPKLAAVRLLAMDVDGVLTDGRIVWSASGGELVETKAFDVKDGLGISLARAGGLRIAWITGRSSALVAQRARELHVERLIEKVRDKGAALLSLCAEWGIAAPEAAFIGDDLNDLLAF